MEWMRCNRCWIRLGSNPSIEFFLTQCGHVFCGQCILEVVKAKCCQCEADGDQLVLPLKPPFDSQIAHFFTPPEIPVQNLLRKEQHEAAQLSFLDESTLTIVREAKYAAGKKWYLDNAETFKRSLENYNRLKVEASMKKKELERMKNSTASLNLSKFCTPSPLWMQKAGCQRSAARSQFFSENKSISPKLAATPVSQRSNNVTKFSGYYSAVPLNSKFTRSGSTPSKVLGMRATPK